MSESAGQLPAPIPAKESAEKRHQLHRTDGIAYAPVVLLPDVVRDNGTGSHGNTHKQVYQ